MISNRHIRVAKKIIRYIISGVSAFICQLLVLFVLHGLFGVHYLIASVIGFFAGLIVSFIMHKYWTFADTENDKVRKQFLLYFGLILFNALLNVLGMRLFVGGLHMQYLLGQFITTALIAVLSYFNYHFIFRDRSIF